MAYSVLPGSSVVERGEIHWTGVDVESVSELESRALCRFFDWLLSGPSVRSFRQLLDQALTLIIRESADGVEDLADAVHDS
jgi:hypothetical protein